MDYGKTICDKNFDFLLLMKRSTAMESVQNVVLTGLIRKFVLTESASLQAMTAALSSRRGIETVSFRATRDFSVTKAILAELNRDEDK